MEQIQNTELFFSVETSIGNISPFPKTAQWDMKVKKKRTNFLKLKKKTHRRNHIVRRADGVSKINKNLFVKS